MRWRRWLGVDLVLRFLGLDQTENDARVAAWEEGERRRLGGAADEHLGPDLGRKPSKPRREGFYP